MTDEDAAFFRDLARETVDQLPQLSPALVALLDQHRSSFWDDFEETYGIRSDVGKRVALIIAHTMLEVGQAANAARLVRGCSYRAVAETLLRIAAEGVLNDDV